jgi:hypothetical protein
MTRHWTAGFKDSRKIVYVTTTDTMGVGSRDAKNRHARLASEAIRNYASARGIALGPPGEIRAIPMGLREVGWLHEYATAHNPVSISATVYEASDNNQRR